MKLDNIEPKKVFEYFEKLSAIPRGSGNMEQISSFCMEFANENSLKAYRDSANNVVIFKDATKGYENSETVMLQGHIDMVCQKAENCKIDFEKDGIDIYTDGDFVKAKDTTLGADNGIAVAMIMAILSDENIEHPPIEAVFTTDEEIGMIGATKLDMGVFKAKKMINIDSEDLNQVTVSCAGGSDFEMYSKIDRCKIVGQKIRITLKGLLGGHSGIEIDKGRVNADTLMGRALTCAEKIGSFDIISINGGDKGNAIPLKCVAELVVADGKLFADKLKEELEIIKNEIIDRENGFEYSIEILDNSEYMVFNDELKNSIMHILLFAPNGVIEMSKEIDGLVQTSLNMGVLATSEDMVSLRFALRSNKKSALLYLEEKMRSFAKAVSFEVSASGHYPPWEFRENSYLQEICKKIYKDRLGAEPQIVAIHAGLECGVFSDAIEGLDCIAIGPDLKDVHTINEKMSISSVKAIYGIILDILKMCK